MSKTKQLPKRKTVTTGEYHKAGRCQVGDLVVFPEYSRANIIFSIHGDLSWCNPTTLFHIRRAIQRTIDHFISQGMEAGDDIAGG